MWSWLIDFFVEGGPVMVPLTIASVIAVAIIIERSLALRRKTVIGPTLAGAIERLRPGETSARLAVLADNDPSALGAIVRVALNHLEWPRTENVEAVQTRARSEAVKLEHGLIALEIVIGISPLLGLLGTLGGLKYLFRDIGQIATETGTTGLGIGISHALNCTFFGLLIAIIALIGWSYFNRKVERMAVEMESMLSDLLSKLYRNSTDTAVYPRMDRRAANVE
ncbi:MAG: MotA/TolQ/ExbB proton channel family protein [Verrucomicrobia bacterium]|nr:MotA/TolQ/ExbB proton channel family protein [Verrucomicrobiota bacterium]